MSILIKRAEIMKKTEALNRQFEPYFRKIHERCNMRDVGVMRLGQEPAAWGRP